MDVPVETVVAHEPGDGARVSQDGVDQRDGGVAIGAQELPQRSTDGPHLSQLRGVAPMAPGIFVLGIELRESLEGGEGVGLDIGVRQRHSGLEGGSRVMSESHFDTLQVWS